MGETAQKGSEVEIHRAKDSEIRIFTSGIKKMVITTKYYAKNCEVNHEAS